MGLKQCSKPKKVQSLNKYKWRSEEVCLLLTLQSWFVLIGSSNREEGIEVKSKKQGYGKGRRRESVSGVTGP